MAKWEQIKKLADGRHCVLFSAGTHYHTRALTEKDKKWYLQRGCSIARHCQNASKKFYEANPDTDIVDC